MKALTYGSTLQFSTSVGGEIGSFNQNCRRQQTQQHFINLNPLKLKRHRTLNLVPAHVSKDSNAHDVESGTFCDSLDGKWLLKAKGREVASCLDGQCLFLVGMMGSGKTTVGEILSDALDYTFADSDKYVEKLMGGTSVAQIFKESGEAYFREYESKALQKLSLVPQQVVATGGGAVVRPHNWRFMRQGITVFLDVPLDALARRIAAVGTDSRPLLDYDSADCYTKAFTALSALSKERSEAYANADATVSLLNLAACIGLKDVLDITPITIAMEVLVQAQKYLNSKRR
ncbi:hypothetical protein AB3S75_014092 [Citrus x aurantiifolia]